MIRRGRGVGRYGAVAWSSAVTNQRREGGPHFPRIPTRHPVPLRQFVPFQVGHDLLRRLAVRSLQSVIRVFVPLDTPRPKDVVSQRAGASQRGRKVDLRRIWLQRQIILVNPEARIRCDILRAVLASENEKFRRRRIDGDGRRRRRRTIRDLRTGKRKRERDVVLKARVSHCARNRGSRSPLPRTSQSARRRAAASP
jgi:hypothetical protein